MRAGQLNRIITINQPEQTAGPAGQQTSWVLFLTCYASISVLSSSEKYQYALFTSSATHKVTIRYQPGNPVRANMQVIFNGRTFIIEAVTDPDEDQRQQDLLCLELNT
jgi:SPP1 family predicted phage head-tail adaptor